MEVRLAQIAHKASSVYEGTLICDAGGAATAQFYATIEYTCPPLRGGL